MIPDRSRTIEFAKIVFAHIEELGLPADPVTYDVMYNYASATVFDLNRDINEILGLRQALTAEEVLRLYEEHLSPARVYKESENAAAATMEQMGAFIGSADRLVGVTEDNRAAVFAMIESKSFKPEAMIELLEHTLKQAGTARAEVEAQREAVLRLQAELHSAQESSLKDPLTGIFNRKHLDQELEKAVREHTPEHPASVLMCDIDHFKTFNDTYGHSTGDQVLRVVAGALRASVKGKDTAARFGGEEFVVILPGTSLSQATMVADGIRREIAERELKRKSTGEHLGRVTMSIGVAALQAGDTAKKLLDRADSCLYVAKRSGRNRVICENDPEFHAAPQASPTMR